MMKTVVCMLGSYFTSYCVCTITSRHTRAAAAEVDAVGEKQAKADTIGEHAAAEADAIGVQFSLTTQD